MEAIWSRFLPAYQRLSELLTARVIGDVQHVDADFAIRFPYEPTHRLFDLALGGGALLDLGIYPLQLASLVLGAPTDVQAVGHIGETGTDEHVAAALAHEGGALATIRTATRVTLTCTARITGTDGSIELPAFMHCPGSLTVTTIAGAEVHDTPIVGEGLRYQVAEVHRCLRAGLLESPVIPHRETVSLATTMDTIREQVGVRYPNE